MKIILDSKRYIVTLAIVIIALATAGSHSWFTGNATAPLGSNMGKLKVEVTAVDNLGESDYYYEPGNGISLTYTFDNVHEGDASYKTAFIKADFNNGTVTTYYNDSGELLAEPETVLIDSSIFDLATIEIKTVVDPETFAIAEWFVDRTTGIYYLLLDPGMDVTADVKIVLSGPAMDNAYQGAEFNFINSFPYTQLMEEAIYDVLGLDLDNLDPIDENGTVLNLYTRSPLRNYYMNFLYDALDES